MSSIKWTRHHSNAFALRTFGTQSCGSRNTLAINKTKIQNKTKQKKEGNFQTGMCCFLLVLQRSNRHKGSIFLSRNIWLHNSQLVISNALTLLSQISLDLLDNTAKKHKKTYWTEKLTFHANSLNIPPSLLTKTKHIPESSKRLSKVIKGTPKDI